MITYPDPFRLGFGQHHARWNGLNIHITPDQPKMQLSARVCEVLAPDFIAETNAWMVRFFGMTNTLPDGQYIVQEAWGRIFMNPRTFEQFKNAINRQGQRA